MSTNNSTMETTSTLHITKVDTLYSSQTPSSAKHSDEDDASEKSESLSRSSSGEELDDRHEDAMDELHQQIPSCTTAEVSRERLAAVEQQQKFSYETVQNAQPLKLKTDNESEELIHRTVLPEMAKQVNHALSLEDFEKLKLLGRGDVGKVYLVRLKGTNQVFAMKVLKKEEMIQINKIKRVLT